MNKKQITSRAGERGFTLMEVMVTAFVFSVVALITVNIFAKAMDIKRKSFSAQIIQENSLAVLELMAKEIRVSSVAGPDSSCLTTTMTITTYDPVGTPVTVIYGVNGNGVVTRQYGSSGPVYFLSSEDVTFESLRFCIQNSAVDGQPTRVTILAAVTNRIGPPVVANIQTTVTSRDMALEFQN